MPCFKSV